ncbi:hypothetical protein MRX96_011902 [Rhipicephalus microplus]
MFSGFQEEAWVGRADKRSRNYESKDGRGCVARRQGRERDSDVSRCCNTIRDDQLAPESRAPLVKTLASCSPGTDLFRGPSRDN